MNRQALELALEALETPWNAPYVDGCDLALGKRVKAITAIKEALAQPEQEQEPVVWMYQDKSTHEVKFQKHMRGFVDHGATYETPLYTTPPQPEKLDQDEVDIRSRLYQRIHELETQLAQPEQCEYPRCACDNKESCKQKAQPEQWGVSAVTHPEYVAEQKAKTQELRSMLAQPEQEPVGEAYLCDRCHTPFNDAWECPSCGHNMAVKEPVYTTPPQRKPLTDEQIKHLAIDVYSPHQEPLIVFARAIEAAHGIK